MSTASCPDRRFGEAHGSRGPNLIETSEKITSLHLELYPLPPAVRTAMNEPTERTGLMEKLTLGRVGVSTDPLPPEGGRGEPSGGSCFSTRRWGVTSTLTSAADRSVRMPPPLG